MTTIRKTTSGAVLKFASDLADNEADILASTSSVDRMGDGIEQGPGAIDYDAWMQLGGVILRDHDNTLPVANAIRANAASHGWLFLLFFAANYQPSRSRCL
jgi:hypothetical protein